MKRLNLAIDLEENEVFDEEVRNLIRAKARELARNEHSRLINEEVSREIKRLTDANAWGCRDKLKGIIRELTIEVLQKTVSNMDIENIAQEKVNDRIEYIVSKTTSEIDEKCRLALKNAIEKSVQEKLNTIMNC